LSRITRGKVQLRRERLQVADVVAKAIEIASPAIDERRQSLQVDIAAGLEIDGDAARLAQVFANLLNNAAKYTEPQGSIHVSARAEPAGVVIRVSDNGNGIAPETLPRIFELFVQERQAPERAQGGLGIGLAIVRSLVQAHRGTVQVESPGKGKGSTFTVTLPIADATQPLPAAPAPPSRVGGAGHRLLLVDDNEDAAMLLADSLRALGHVVEVAHDGPSALGLLEAFKPGVAVLDLGLPVMDGFELGERLRADPELHGIVLVAVTGYAQELDRRRSTASGFDVHMAKPIDVHELDRLIRGHATPTA
jgi:CheY-like chemotaxis protein/two-component sensor histidine kinase